MGIRRLVCVLSAGCFLGAVLAAAAFTAQSPVFLADRDFLPEDVLGKYSGIIDNAIAFLDKQGASETGLIESFQGTSRYYYLPEQESFYLGSQGYLDGQCFTYDAATASILYAICGKPEKAKALLGLLEHDFYQEKNGHRGLYTSYRTDKFTPEGELWMGIDGDRIHVGPTMWVALACLHYAQISTDRSFLGFAVDIAGWAGGLDHYRFADGSKGAVCMGSGWGPDWGLTYSTENCFVYYAVLNLLLEVYQKGSPEVKSVFIKKNLTEEAIRKEMTALQKWFKEVAYDSRTGGLNCGAGEGGVDTTKAIDTVTNAVIAVGPDRLSQWGIDPFRLVGFAETYLRITETCPGKNIEGFDFTVPEELGNPRQRVIWIEGTAQMITAYKLMADYSARKGFFKKAEECRNKAMSLSQGLDGLSLKQPVAYGVLPYTSVHLADKERMLSFAAEWEIPRGIDGSGVGCVSSTVWRAFSLVDFNPMQTAVASGRYAEK